jgi:hypothetical protein
VGVIIALGYGNEAEGHPEFKMAQRVGTAVEAYRKGRAKVIMFCGGYTSGHVAEAEEMKIMAMALGIPEQAILLENGSISTVENARNAQLLVDKRRFRSALLITHRNHLARATKEFKKIKRLRHIHRVPADDWVPPKQELASAYELPPPDQIQAVIIHGKSAPVDFRGDTTTLDKTQLSLARTMAWLYQSGYTGLPYFVWHKAFSTGHVTRAEIIGIAAVALGVPSKVMEYGVARRFAPGKKGLFDTCNERGWKRVLAVLPKEREDDLELVEQQYNEAGIEATVVTVAAPSEAQPKK